MYSTVFLFLRIRVPILLDVVEYALQRDTERVLVVIRIFLLQRCQVTVQIVRLSRGCLLYTSDAADE